MKHVVLGTGSAPDKVIVEGLNDILKEGDELAFAWSGSPVPPSLEAVYGYVLDNEIPFTMVYTEEQKVPGSFRMAEHGVVQKVRNPISSLLKDLEGGNVLLLWDDEENGDGGIIHQVFDAHPEARVLELSNGLAPIVADVESVQPAESYDADDSAFTKDQLVKMADAAVIRYGKHRGCDASTKDGIIAELFGGDVPPAEIPPISSPDNIPFEMEITTLIGNFFQHSQPGFDSDMAHLALGQARLWMLKSLARVED